MEVDTKYNLLRNTLQYFNHIQKTKGLNEKLDYFKKNNYLLSVISVNSKITKEVIDYYNLDKIKDFNLEKNPNFNINWVKYYPNREWDFRELSSNPNFKIKWIELYTDREWDFNELSRNPNFKIDWINLYPDREWNFNTLKYHKNFQLEWIKLYPDLKWNLSYNYNVKYDYKITNKTLKNYVNINNKNLYHYLSNNKNFNIDWINQYPYKPWDITKLNLKLEDIYNITKNNPYIIYNLHNFEKEDNFKFDFIRKYPNLNWNFYNIPIEQIDINFVKQYPNKNWYAINIVNHPKITKDILKYMINNNNNRLFKITYEIIYNKYFNPEWFKEYFHVNWDYDKIEETHNFDIRWVLNYYNIRWPYIYNQNNYKKSYNKEETKNEQTKYSILNFDKDFDIDWIIKYPERNWNYEILSLHPNFKLSWINYHNINKFNCNYMIKKIKTTKQLYNFLTYFKNIYNKNCKEIIEQCEDIFINKKSNNYKDISYDYHRIKLLWTKLMCKILNNLSEMTIITIEIIIEFYFFNWNYDILYKN